MSLILASSSPFRKAILDKLGLDFEVVAPEINEARRENESPIDLVARLSKEKAMAVAKSKTGLIIASDQVATLDSGYNPMTLSSPNLVVMKMQSFSSKKVLEKL